MSSFIICTFMYVYVWYCAPMSGHLGACAPECARAFSFPSCVCMCVCVCTFVTLYVD